jgi:hypothetical protein
MSIRLMAEVWTLDITHAQQSILLALCDHADDDGGNCYPSVAYTAWRTNYSERQTQRVLRELEEMHVIVPTAQGIGRGNVTHYQIYLFNAPKKPPFKKGVRMSPVETKGDISGSQSPTNGAGKGDMAMAPESPIETLMETGNDFRLEKRFAEQMDALGSDRRAYLTRAGITDYPSWCAVMHVPLPDTPERTWSRATSRLKK